MQNRTEYDKMSLLPSLLLGADRQGAPYPPEHCLNGAGFAIRLRSARGETQPCNGLNLEEVFR